MFLTYSLTFFFMLLGSEFTRGLQTAAIFTKTNALLKLEVTDFNFLNYKLMSFRQ